MNAHAPLVRHAAVAALAATLLAGLATAQSQMRTATDPAETPPPIEIHSTLTQPKANGDTVIVRSGMPARQPAGAAPAFAILDQRQRGYLDEEDARGYPLLATDFIYADGNRDGRISREEYERWTSKR